MLEMGSRAVLATPILVFGKRIGVLSIHRTTAGRWSDVDVALVEALARELGLGIHTAQLVVENERQARDPARLLPDRVRARSAAVARGDPRRASRRPRREAFGGDVLGGADAAAAARSHVVGAHDLPDAVARSTRRRGSPRMPTRSASLHRSASSWPRPRWPATSGSRSAGAASGRPAGSGRSSSCRSSPATTQRASSSSSSTRSGRFSDDDLELARHLAGAGARRARAERRCSRPSGRRARSRSSSPAPAASSRPSSTRQPCSTRWSSRRRRCSAPTRARSGRSRTTSCVVTAAAGGERRRARCAPGATPRAAALRRGRRSRGAPVAVDRRGVRPRALRVRRRCSRPATPRTSACRSSGPRARSTACWRSTAAAARAWREEEVEALVALAANTSAALSNAELYQRVALEKERSVAILANIADGIVAVDREGKVVLWNARRRADHRRPCGRGARRARRGRPAAEPRSADGAPARLVPIKRGARRGRGSRSPRP